MFSVSSPNLILFHFLIYLTNSYLQSHFVYLDFFLKNLIFFFVELEFDYRWATPGLRPPLLPPTTPPWVPHNRYWCCCLHMFVLVRVFLVMGLGFLLIWVLVFEACGVDFTSFCQFCVVILSDFDVFLLLFSDLWIPFFVFWLYGDA